MKFTRFLLLVLFINFQIFSSYENRRKTDNDYQWKISEKTIQYTHSPIIHKNIERQIRLTNSPDVAERILQNMANDLQYAKCFDQLPLHMLMKVTEVCGQVPGPIKTNLLTRNNGKLTLCGHYVSIGSGFDQDMVDALHEIDQRANNSQIIVQETDLIQTTSLLDQTQTAIINQQQRYEGNFSALRAFLKNPQILINPSFNYTPQLSQVMRKIRIAAKQRSASQPFYRAEWQKWRYQIFDDHMQHQMQFVMPLIMTPTFALLGPDHPFNNFAKYKYEKLHPWDLYINKRDLLSVGISVGFTVAFEIAKGTVAFSPPAVVATVCIAGIGVIVIKLIDKNNDHRDPPTNNTVDIKPEIQNLNHNTFQPPIFNDYVSLRGDNNTNNNSSNGKNGNNKFPQPPNDPNDTKNKNDKNNNNKNEINSSCKRRQITDQELMDGWKELKDMGYKQKDPRHNSYKLDDGKKGIHGADRIAKDQLHNEIELWKNNKHLGAIDPITKQFVKAADPQKNIKLQSGK